MSVQLLAVTEDWLVATGLDLSCIPGLPDSCALGAILSVRDPTQTELPILAWLGLPERARAAIVHGQRLLVATDLFGVQVVEMANPGAPRRLGPLHLTTRALAVAERDGIAFVAGGESGLHTVDMRDPHRPAELGPFPSPSDTAGQPAFASDIELVGPLAILAEGDGLAVLDVTTPTLAVRAARLPLGAIGDVGAAGVHAYAASGSRLFTVDVSRPFSPTLTATLDLGETIAGLDPQPDWLYAAAGALRVLDRRLPALPSPLGGFGATRMSAAMQLAGSTLYVIDCQSGLWILDAVDPNRLRVLGHAQLAAGALRVVGDRAFLVSGHDDCASGDKTLHVFDVSVPTEPGHVLAYGPFRSTLWSADVEAMDGYAFVADGNLHVVELPSPTRPEAHHTTVDLHVTVTELHLSGNTLYVAAEDGVHFLDVSRPLAPRRLGGIPMEGALAPIVDDGLLLVSDRHGTLRIYDVSDPRRPAFRSALEAAGGILPATSGHLVLTAPCRGGFCLIDVQDPSRPRIIASRPGTGPITALALHGDRAYVAGATGVQAFDVSDPTAPWALGLAEAPAAPLHVRAVGSTVFVFTQAGCYAFDTSTPARPHLLHADRLLPGAHDLRVVDDLGYSAEGTAGVAIDELADRTQLRELARHRTVGTAHRVGVAGSRLYVADQEGGLVVLEIVPAAEIHRLSLPSTSTPLPMHASGPPPGHVAGPRR